MPTKKQISQLRESRFEYEHSIKVERSMKTTKDQKNAIASMRDYGQIEVGETLHYGIHGRTMSALRRKGLVTTFRYANGEFWSLTNEGLKIKIDQ